MLNGLMNSLSKHDINIIAERSIDIIKDTLENPIYDAPCKRMAVGLFQDMSTPLEELMS